MKFISQLKRSHYCGEIDRRNENQNVVLMGWVNTRRDHGGLVFIDLRDRSGRLGISEDEVKAALDG